MLISMSGELHFNGHFISLQSPNVSAWTMQNLFFFFFIYIGSMFIITLIKGVLDMPKVDLIYLNFSTDMSFNFLLEKQKLIKKKNPIRDA